jgi:hypothetical protein
MKTYSQSDLNAAIAEAVRMCAKTICVGCADEIPLDKNKRHTGYGHVGSHCYAYAILATLPATVIVSLEDRELVIYRNGIKAGLVKREARERRIVAEARLEEAKWWHKAIIDEFKMLDEGGARVAELQAALEKT